MALILSTALTSAVGLVYWVIGARLFPPEVLGVNQAALSAVMLLGGVAHLNMTYALLRFVPVAGRAGRRLVVGGYLVAGVLASLVGGVFALGARVWAPQMLEVVSQGALLAFFMVATPVWALFTVQDYVLTGIRKAKVVPLENAIFAVLKVGLLIASLAATFAGGIAVSWMVGTAVIVLGVNVWLLFSALPRFGREHEADAVPITLGAIGRFVRSDYAGSVFQQAAFLGLPVLVLARLGAESSAAYGIVWQIGQTLFLVSSSMNQSMVAHTASDPGGIEKARRAMIRKSLTLIVPAAVVLVLGGRLLLSIFGEHYSSTGALTLALVALAAIPNVVNSSTISAARVRQRMGVLFAVPATVATIVITTSWLLMPYLGITAVGIGWLLGHSVVALVILVATAPWLPPLLGTRVDALRTAALLRRVGGPAGRLSREGDDGEPWVVHGTMTGGSESVVAGIGPQGGPGALLKACDTERSRQALQWQTEVLAILHADPRVEHWMGLAPSVLGVGDIGGSYCVIETRMPGGSAVEALRDPVRSRVTRASAISTISEFHRCIGEVRVVGDAELQTWVHVPMSHLVEALPRAYHADALALAAELDDRLRGKRVAVGWMHGDFGPVNMLAAENGEICAVIDWCEAIREGFQVLDVVTFMELGAVQVGGEELGPLLLRWLSETPPHEFDILGRLQRALGGDVVDARVLLVLGWLQHASHAVTKTTQAVANPVWNRKNLRLPIRGMLPLLAEHPGPGPDAAAEFAVTRSDGASSRA
ncbi:MAG: phosphotransferase [Pseudonocardia sp.]|nr:phosphotransferase [Pseudonocardia sp.]